MDLISRLEPDMAAIFPQFGAMDMTNIPGARDEITARMGVQPAPRASVSREDRHLPGVDGAEVLVRIYRPAAGGTGLPALVWVHGGGYVMGHIDRDNSQMEDIVDTLGCVVVSVEWRQAPEHPFPASHNDAYTAITWVLDNSNELGIDPERIVMGGASSGAGTVSAVVLRLRDEGRMTLALQFLVYPMLDDRNVTDSSHAITDSRLWNRDANLLAWRAYLGDAAGTDAVPRYGAAARATDLTELPPTFICVGDLDLFLDEDLEYARRLLAAGISTEVHVYPGAVHGFYTFTPASHRARQFFHDRDEALRLAFRL